MTRRTRRSDPRPRIHLLAHANPIAKDVERFGFDSLDEYLDFIRASIPAELNLTFTREILEALETPDAGGRTDDALRIRDLQAALDDSATRAIVALSGGGYFSRILPHIRFTTLARRKQPLIVSGFSEMTNLLNLVAGYSCARAWYWLCPNYLAWKIKPATDARAAFADFLRVIAESVTNRNAAPCGDGGPLEGPSIIPLQIAAGRVKSGRIRIFGGCLSVLAVLAAARKRPAVVRSGSWLMIEDVNEAPHRIDRQIAALKFAGWFDRVGGVIVGDFHMDGIDQKPLTVEILKYHASRGTPIVTAPQVGHVWPMVGVPLGRRLPLHIAAGARDGHILLRKARGDPSGRGGG